MRLRKGRCKALGKECKEANVPGGECTRVAGGDGDREEAWHQGSDPNLDSLGSLGSDLQ